MVLHTLFLNLLSDFVGFVLEPALLPSVFLTGLQPGCVAFSSVFRPGAHFARHGGVVPVHPRPHETAFAPFFNKRVMDGYRVIV